MAAVLFEFMSHKEQVLQWVPVAFCYRTRKNGLFCVTVVGSGIRPPQVFYAMTARQAWTKAYEFLK